MAPGPVQASVIIPALNAAEHIGEQLLALARQRTEVSWELIVADNGSSDRTVGVVESVAPQIAVPVRIVDASARTGVSAARNAGAAVAAGELLLFTDADDVVDDLWVQEMVSALRGNPFVGGKEELSELNGEVVCSWRRPMGEAGLAVFWGRPYVRGGNFGCTTVAYTAVGGFDETLLRSVDIDFSLAMLESGITPVFAERAIVHYRYRRDPGQTLRQMWDWGRFGATLYARHGIEPPTFVDAARVCFRAAKLAVRDLLHGRRPVRSAGDITMVVAEAATIWRDPGFWQPVARGEPMENVWAVQRQRIGRLARLIGRGARAR
jgi:glycosyltransferase involved in cell wall biosynthesis